jgi:hypothetical protein
LDAATLTPVVRAALQSETAEVNTWQVSPILQGKASPAGISRISGTVREQNRAVPWSLMLKQFQATAKSAYAGNNASDDPTETFYWKRELLLYQSGLFDDLPAGIAAPRCFQVDELPNAGRIWMEDVREDLGATWPLEHYGHVARHFGRFNGLYLAGRPLPTWPWLLTHQLPRRILESDWPHFAASYPALRHASALVRRGWSDELVQEFERIWQDRERFVQALEHLPRTLQHNDAGRKNLFARRHASGDLETVAVDWGSAAITTVGEELAVILTQPVYWFNGVRPEQLWELDGLAFDGYLQGLRDVGWRGDPAVARLGYTLAVILRAGFGIFIVEWAARDENTRRFIENANGHPIEETADVMRGLRAFIIACADEARQLIASPTVKRL